MPNNELSQFFTELDDTYFRKKLLSLIEPISEYCNNKLKDEHSLPPGVILEGHTIFDIFEADNWPHCTKGIHRALMMSGIVEGREVNIEDLADHSEQEIKDIYGIGKLKLKILKEYMDKYGIKFRE